MSVGHVGREPCARERRGAGAGPRPPRPPGGVAPRRSPREEPPPARCLPPPPARRIVTRDRLCLLSSARPLQLFTVPHRRASSQCYHSVLSSLVLCATSPVFVLPPERRWSTLGACEVIGAVRAPSPACGRRPAARPWRPLPAERSTPARRT